MVRGQSVPSSNSPVLRSQLLASVSRSSQSTGRSQILFANARTTPVIVAEASRHDVGAVDDAASMAVRNLLPTLGLPENAAVQAMPSQQVAKVWHTSFGVSYNGIPVSDLGIQTTIGAISGKLMLTDPLAFLRTKIW